MLTIADTDQICFECIEEYIISKFHQALEREASFPVVWGTTRLEPSQFVDWLDSTFVQRYTRRKEEYDCHDRIYCPHVIVKVAAPPIGEIANERLALTSTQQANLPSYFTEPCGGFVTQRSARFGIVTCSRCLGPVSSCCGAAHWAPSTNHECSSQDATDPLAELTKGKDYQVCPSCTRSFALLDGCNHISCPCGGSYCFICGQAVEESSGHWNSGNLCPRYNHPDSANAQFDDPPSNDPIIEEFSDENGRPFAILFGEEGIDQQLAVPFTRLQQVTSEHLNQEAMGSEDAPEYTSWLRETLPFETQALFYLDFDEISWGGLYSTGGFPLNEVDARARWDNFGRVSEEILSFFDARDELLTTIVEELLPLPQETLPHDVP